MQSRQFSGNLMVPYSLFEIAKRLIQSDKPFRYFDLLLSTSQNIDRFRLRFL